MPDERPGLLERLRERTSRAGPSNVPRGPIYNVPDAWYCRPDGDIVKLQGDPWNRAYYEDLGFAYLRADEAREWERDIRPQVIQQQRHRAALINTIRRLGRKKPELDAMVEDTVRDDTTTEELEKILQEIGEATNTPIGPILRREERASDVRTGSDDEPSFRGVEVAAGELFEKKIARGQARPGGPRRDEHAILEGTGYDPMTGRANPK